MAQKQSMRFGAEAWLVILAAGVVLGFVAYPIVGGWIEHRQFLKDCADMGVDRMVQRPSDDDFRRLVDDCERGRRSR
jgi:hypothetical protein